MDVMLKANCATVFRSRKDFVLCFIAGIVVVFLFQGFANWKSIFKNFFGEADKLSF